VTQQGLNVLVRAPKRALAEGGALRVAVAEPTLIRIFTVISADQMVPVFAHPSAGGYFALRAKQTGAQVAERAGEQTRYVHLGNTELLGDLGLAHVTVKPQQQDPLLAGGQASPVRHDRLHLYRVLNPRVLLAHQISEAVLLTAS
jgi:hypothetical protein